MRLFKYSIPLLALILSACSSGIYNLGTVKDGGPDRHVDLDRISNATPKIEPKSRYGNPSTYEVFGKRYSVMNSSAGFTEQGIASWYGNKFHGRRTSSGEPYDMFAMTAAHKHLPLPTYVEVTNLENDRKIIVKVNDRGPFHQNRIIDLSYVAAAKLGITARGTGLVEIRAIDPAHPEKTIAKNPSKPAAKIHNQPEIYIQAGAFGNRDNAVRLQTKLSTSLGKPVRLSETSVNNTIFYRVQVGPVLQVEIADDISLSLEKLGISNLKAVIE